MSEDGTDTSSLDERPVYFRVFTRESLRAIRNRMDEEAARNALEAKEAKEKKKQEEQVS